ncbi:hypothetical protein TNCV_4031001 [Trichonephila clavipes]|nr:hypothetical protein TNCV_4031001 [Trichonephila clavipes]
MNATFGDGSANKCTIRHRYANFASGDESLTNEDRGCSETVVAMKSFEQNSSDTVREYAEELCVTSTIIYRRLKMVGKVKKRINELNENKKVNILKHLLPFFVTQTIHFSIKLLRVTKKKDFVRQSVTFRAMG